ncbi:MAG TPA: ABC transporter ATP-binding protein [Trueperaceae bacterium]|nr:ABC transporter ATP-binding protein [Trueperaceae bacterium]
MLEATGLSVIYGKHLALDRVSLAVAEGEIVVVLGANGAGKSSLLQAVAGLTASSGEIRLHGSSLRGVPPHRVVEAGVAFVPEGRGVFGPLTVAENLLLGAHAQRARGRENQNRRFVLDLFPRLEERLGQVVRTMSGGEQQMVAIGRALMSAPDLLLLDEPSLGLAPLLRQEMFRVLGQVRDRGMGILMVEQNARQSLALADRGYLLETGRISGSGTAAELKAAPAVQRAYLGLTVT